MAHQISEVFGSSAESVCENQLANDSEVTKHGVWSENAAESHHRFQAGFIMGKAIQITRHRNS